MRQIGCRYIAFVGLVVLSFHRPYAFGEDWPNFRGPRHDGVSAEHGLQTAWPTGVPLRWERTIGSAYSSFACVGNRVYTCGETDAKQTLYCLDADTGKVVWKNAFEAAIRDSHGDGTRSTPTVDDGLVYILGGHGKLICADAATGIERWSHQFSNKPTWGYSGSILIEGNLAISSGGAADGAVVAFHKKTGKIAWTCGNDPVGYGTPYPFDFAGRRYVVVFTGNSALVVDVKLGKQVGRIPWKTDWDVNAASPIFHADHLFLTSGYKTGSGLFEIRKENDGLSFTSVWKSKALLNKFQSPILHEGNLYSSDQRAFKCIDFMTGKEHWSQRRLKHGTLAMAEGYLYFLTESGELQIGKASPGGFVPDTRADILDGRCWSVSVLHRGRIYARNLDRVACFNLKP